MTTLTDLIAHRKAVRRELAELQRLKFLRDADTQARLATLTGSTNNVRHARLLREEARRCEATT